MGLDRAFQLSTILLAAIAFLGLALTAGLPVGFQVLGFSGLLLSLMQALRPTSPAHAHQSPLSTQFWNAVIVLAFGWFWIDFMWFAQDLLAAGVHFLIALMVNKLFNLQLRRDYLQLYAISLMMILASAGMTADLWYGTIIVAYLMVGVWTLLLYHLFMEARPGSAGPGALRQEVGGSVRFIDARFFWTTNAFALAAFGLTLLIFFSIPRIGAGFFQKGRSEGLRTAGFSEKVDLGAIGAIKLDDSIVMRVEFPDGNTKPSEPFYLRGMAYDWYNGRAWVNTSRRRRLPTDAATKLFHLPAGRKPGASPQPRTRLMAHDILLEPLDTTVLFGASMPRSIEGEFSSLQVDAMGGMYLPVPVHGRTQYRVWSSPIRLQEQDRHAAQPAYPEDIRRHYLQLPALSAEVAALGEEQTRHARTPHEKVRALYALLQSQYRYSLDVGRSGTAPPLEEFLFARKTGYCEHYATALVVLLRTVGVPARLVTGFMPTEWNEYGKYFTVRQRDAHAWVEVYFPSSGWVTIDPTPSVTGPASRGMWADWSSFLDSVRLQWDRLIVQYSATDQLAVVQTLRDGTDSVRTRVSEAWHAWTEPWLVRLSTLIAVLRRSNTYGLLALLGLLLIGWGLVRLIGVVRRRLTAAAAALPGREEAAAQQLYGQMLKILAKRGFEKPPSATPQEFLHAVSGTWREAAPALQALTQLYYGIRFGGQAYTAEEFQLADEWLARLRTLPRHADSAEVA